MSTSTKLADQRRLEELEGVIRRDLDTFHAVGGELLAIGPARLAAYQRVSRALAEVHEAGLYRPLTWETYCAKWGISRRHGYRLITYAEVLDDVCPTGHGEQTPTERQARELAPLDGEERLRVWQEANEEGQPQPTAERLAELRRKAMASLTPEEQREVVEGNEAQVNAGERAAAQVGGEGRKELLAAVDSSLRKAGKKAAGLGDGAVGGIALVEQARAFFAGLPAA